MRHIPFFFVFLLSVLLSTSACVNSSVFRTADSIRLDDVNARLRLIKQAAAYSLPGGIRDSSENRRVFRSKYMDLKGERWDVLSKDRHRAYAEIAVLGDRRPYSIEFDVIVEERGSRDPMDRNFEEVGHSKALAQKIHTRFVNYLEDRRKRRNLIDEFKAF